MNKLDEIIHRLDRIERLLTDPAQTLSAERKAEEIRKAAATGDKKVLRETLRQINGR